METRTRPALPLACPDGPADGASDAEPGHLLNGLARPVAFIINAHSGPAKGNDPLADLQDTMRAIAGEGEVTRVGGSDEIATAVKRAQDMNCRAIVAAGGDGTLNAVASRLVGGDIALGVLPLGTLNHFAKDLGIPLDIAAALELLRDGSERAVDVGEVNGRYFLNNSGLGLYPRIVHERELQQSRLGRSKWPAFAWATATALRRYPFLDVRVTRDGHSEDFRTPFIFVGNNAYRLEGWKAGGRSALDAGVLTVAMAQRTGRLGMLGLAFRALSGHLREARDFRAALVRDLVIHTRHAQVRVSTDGEIQMLDTPLRYRVHPGALRVIAPAAAASAETAAGAAPRGRR